MGFDSSMFLSNLPLLASSNGCNKTESQASNVCVSCQVWETDALNISLEGLDGYVFCPVALIPQVIQKIATFRCRIIILYQGGQGCLGLGIWWICPQDSSKTSIVGESVDSAIQQQVLQQHLAYLNLHAGHLESFMSIQEDSQRMWQNELRSLRRVPQGESVNQVVYFWEVV